MRNSLKMVLASGLFLAMASHASDHSNPPSPCPDEAYATTTCWDNYDTNGLDNWPSNAKCVRCDSTFRRMVPGFQFKSKESAGNVERECRTGDLVRLNPGIVPPLYRCNVDNVPLVTTQVPTERGIGGACDTSCYEPW